MGMLDVKQCCKAAEECRREAERSVSPVDRERWLSLAADWTKLASGHAPGFVARRFERLRHIVIDPLHSLAVTVFLGVLSAALRSRMRGPLGRPPSSK